MAKLIPLDEAAKLLGVSSEKLTEMRSHNEIFGYRDGSTWKFKQQEIDRVASQMGVDVDEGGSRVSLPMPSGNDDNDLDADLDEMVDLSGDDDESTDGPDSVLVSEQELGHSEPGASSTIIGKNQLGGGAEDDLDLSLDESESSEELVLGLDDDEPMAPVDGGDSSGATSGDAVAADAPDEELKLESSDVDLGGSDLDLADGESELRLGEESSVDPSPTPPSGPDLGDSASDLDLDLDDADSELDLSGASSDLKLEGAADDDVSSDKDVTSDKSDSALSGSSLLLGGDDGDLSLEASDVDLAGSGIDLDAGSGTDVKLGGVDSDVTLNTEDSGINLSSPGDSGISLESTPSELAAGGDVEALELGDADVVDLGDEAVDLDDSTVMTDDDFLLTPVEGGDALDDDSGSQVIALDTDEIDPDEATLIGEGLDEDAVEIEEGVEAVAPLGAPGGVASAPESAYTLGNVIGLGLCVLILAISGMMITDLVRSMWSWDTPFMLNSSLMDMIVGK